MRVSLDTNVWIFGIVGVDDPCERILFNLAKYEVVVPNQVRTELERNLSDFDMRQFYRFLLSSGVIVDFGRVPPDLVAAYETMGLKKGDAEIGAFCEWRQIDVIVSYNRDFLRGLSALPYFEVMSPQEFCEKVGI